MPDRSEVTPEKPDIFRGWKPTWTEDSIMLEKGESLVTMDRHTGIAILTINDLDVREWDLYTTDGDEMINTITRFLEAT